MNNTILLSMHAQDGGEVDGRDEVASSPGLPRLLIVARF